MNSLASCTSVAWGLPTRMSGFVKKSSLYLWFCSVWIDIVIMIGVLILVWFFSIGKVPIFLQHHRRFPMQYSREDLWYGPVAISRPKESLLLGNFTAAILFVVLPIGVILALQAFIRDFWDANAAIFGLLKGLVTMCVS